MREGSAEFVRRRVVILDSAQSKSDLSLGIRHRGREDTHSPAMTGANRRQPLIVN
jgi:hypothetical protein